MKKLFSILLCVFAFSFTTHGVETLNQKQITKLAKKEAKRLKKEGWIVTPGAMPLEVQLEGVYLKENDKDEVGRSNYIIGSSQPIAQMYDAALRQANTLARVNIAENISSELTALIEASVGNKQLNQDEATSIVQVIAKSKELVSAKLGRTTSLLECHRKLSNGNYEVMLRVGYPTAAALEKAKEAIREQLEKDLKELGEKFDKIDFSK